MVVTGPLDLQPGASYNKSDSRGNSIKLSANGSLQISGIVFVNGDINFNPDMRSGKRDLVYTGRGTLVSTGNIDVHTDLLPAGSFFPMNNALGLIARRQMNLATGAGDAQLKMVGAFYAQEKVLSYKQNSIAGTFVSSYFDMFNVPKLYQVPSLPDNLPPGMPGSDRIWVKTVRVDSWRET